jgi:hypothetical protein
MSVLHHLVHGAHHGAESGLKDSFSGLLFGSGLKKSLHAGYEMSFKGSAIFTLPMTAFAMGMAPRGQTLSAAAGGLSTGVASFVGGMFGGLPGAMVAGYFGDEAISSTVGKLVQKVHDLGVNNRKLGMGGNYQDSEQAYTMRQLAAQEMSGSLMNARQWLGRESVQMHSY